MIKASICALGLGLILVAACGDSDGGPNGGGDADGGGTDGTDAGPAPTGDNLDTASGCEGVYNPDQMLDYEIAMADADFTALRNDSTNSIYFRAQLSCGTFAPIEVGVRRKRSGGNVKVSIKVDINEFVVGQRYFDLKKLSLESGIGEGSTDTEAFDLVAEYLAWRLMSVSGALTGRAALARVIVNGDPQGVYVNVEQVDKRFLDRRLGDNTGWLFKFSGSPRDGQKTNEGLDNPFADELCFLDKNGCALPSASELATILPQHLAVDQLLIMGAVNAIMGNADSPLLKDNNYYYYDFAGGPRYYFPWDLDTVMKETYSVVTGSVGGGTSLYVDPLFANGDAAYRQHLVDLLSGPLALSVILDEIARAETVAGAAIDADPLLGDGAADARGRLDAYWNSRHAEALSQAQP